MSETRLNIFHFVKSKYTAYINAEKIVFLQFSISTFLRTVALAISGLVIMRWIKPEQMGIYNSYNILITYSFFLQLGVFNGLNRQIPFLIGQKNEEEALKLTSASLAYAKILSFSVLIIGILVSFVLMQFFSISQEKLVMLMAIFGLTSISFYQNYLNVTYRALKHFKVLSVINNVTSALIFLSLALVYFFSYNGLVLYYVINGLVYLILTHLYRPYKINSVFSFYQLKNLVIIGMPIFSFGYMLQITRSFNRLILVMLGSVYVVGLFSPASAIYSSIYFLPTTIAQFLYPKFSYLYGKHNDKKMFVPYVNKIYILSTVLIIPTLLVSYLVLPWAFHQFIPEYTAGIFASQMFLICGVIDITTITINIFFSIGDRRTVLIYTLIKMALMFFVPLIFSIFFEILTAVALGTTLSTLSSAIIGYILLIKTLNADHN